MTPLPVLRADPPLDPSGDEARRMLARELAHPEYHRANLVERVLTWLQDLLNATSGASAVSSFAAIVVFLLLGLALAWLLSRAQRTARTRPADGPVHADETVTAAELRAAAERALADGRHADAVVDGFRALAVRQVERGRLEDRPGATVHEVAVALAAANPEHRDRVDGSATLFDAVLYGDRPATREQAANVLALDDALADRR